MHSFHLLLVDDHENICFTLRLASESDGYNVDTAGTVTESHQLTDGIDVIVTL